MRLSTSRLAFAASFLALTGVSAGGCAKKKPTAIIVSVQSEAPIPREISSLEIQVDRAGSTPFFEVYDLAGAPDAAEARLPGTLTLKKEDSEDANGAVTVTIRARLGGSQWRVIRQARLGFIDEKTKLLKMPLRYSCVDFPCEGTDVCVGGVCVPPDVDVQKLPDYEDRLVSFTPKQGVCFDESALAITGCFPAATTKTIAVDASTLSQCQLDVSKLVDVSAGKLNLALQWAGALDPTQFNTIDQDAEEGWTFAPGSTTTVVLSQGLCNAFAPQKGMPARVVGLRASTQCAPKVASQPLCDNVTLRSKTLGDSACFRCSEMPSQCRASYDAALASAASHDFLGCIAACTIGGTTQTATFTAPTECPDSCHAACASRVRKECQSNLDAPACSEYAALSAYVLCLDMKYATSGASAAARRAARYNACKSQCDGEGFQNVCLSAGTGGAGGSGAAGGSGVEVGGSGGTGTAGAAGAKGGGPGCSTGPPALPQCSACEQNQCGTALKACQSDATCACCLAQKSDQCFGNALYQAYSSCACSMCAPSCTGDATFTMLGCPLVSFAWPHAAWRMAV